MVQDGDESVLVVVVVPKAQKMEAQKEQEGRTSQPPMCPGGDPPTVYPSWTLPIHPYRYRQEFRSKQEPYGYRMGLDLG